MKSKAIYVRVSRDDLNSDKQIPDIIKHFNLTEYELFQEIESAYKEDKQKNRLEFTRLKDVIEDGIIKDVYVFSTERFERNVERMFEFFFFCQANNCNIHSVLQNIIQKKEDEEPIEKMIRYFNVLLYGFMGEEESFKTSKRTKQSFHKVNGITYSYKGNKVGKPFTDTQGNTISLTEDELKDVQDKILELVKTYEKKGNKGYYKEIIEKIAQIYSIQVSKAYISKLRKCQT